MDGARKKSGTLWGLLFFFGAAILLTWPIAISLGQASGLRGDYFNNLWNFWWVRHSLSELSNPWFTDYLYYPDGLSLKRHTLSPLNSLAGALIGSVLGGHATFNVLLIAKFALAGWTFFLFARYATGSFLGALLGGLLYTFNPFHYYYLCQINVFTFEFLPLALLYFLRTYREGGWRNSLGAVLSCGALAATTSYYVVYAYMIVGLLLACGRLIDPEVPWGAAARRTTLAALGGAAAVAVVALPLLIGIFGAEAATAEDTGLQARRTNDLLGYAWLGGPEEGIVSWPTMLGYSTLLFLAYSARALWRQRFWLLVGALFFVLGLGETLLVAGRDTGVPLPYALLSDLPVLSMLRKADRAFMVVQLVVALLCAQAWSGVSERLRSGGIRTGAFTALAAVMMFELSGAPFARFDYDAPAYVRALADDDGVERVLELPAMDIDTINSRYNFFQTFHGKKEPLGYCTTLARSQANIESMQLVVNTYWWIFRDRSTLLFRWAEKNGIDLIVHHKTIPYARGDALSSLPVEETVHEQVVWRPFFLARRALVGIRQMGKYVDQPMLARNLRDFHALASATLGPPVHEDDDVMVFEVSRP